MSNAMNDSNPDFARIGAVMRRNPDSVAKVATRINEAVSSGRPVTLSPADAVVVAMVMGWAVDRVYQDTAKVAHAPQSDEPEGDATAGDSERG